MARNKLQLLGVVCLLLATKVEEIFHPSADEFVNMSDGAFRREDLLRAERHVLRRLEYRLNAVTPLTHLRRLLRAVRAERATEMTARFLTELGLVSYEISRHPPSMLATAAVVVALHSQGVPHWGPQLERYSRYSAADVGGVVRLLHRQLVDSPNMRPGAIPERYAHGRFINISTRVVILAEAPEM